VFGGQMRGAPILPLAVDFRHAAPADASEHARLFGVSPRFGVEVNAIEFDRATIEQPLASADPALSSVIERHAEALLAARPEPAETTANRVRRLLGAMLGEGEVSLAGAASRLRMSERSLQRRLAAEGVSFDAVLDELRRDLALRYLADARLAIAEVAYLLGYSEPSAFHRAFKRWTGETPAEARLNLGH
jgi:AraC-like DNA-binding protein